MLKFAANLSMMYPEHHFLDRFDAAASDGFRGVEYLFPYEHPAAQLRRRLDAAGLTQVLINAPAGDWASGERGIASVPGRQEEFSAGLRSALEYAAELGCPRIHVMAGTIPSGTDDAHRRTRWDTYRKNIDWAARRAAAYGIDILVEAINHRDMPGYLLFRQSDAHALVESIGAPNVKVQLDLYHCQITEGDITTTLRRDLPTGRVGHLQIAGVPERHEPNNGELNLPHVISVLDQLHFDGWVGCEYSPAGRTSDGLGWLRALRGARV